jgi:hypothetical protein
VRSYLENNKNQIVTPKDQSIQKINSNKDHKALRVFWQMLLRRVGDTEDTEDSLTPGHHGIALP